MFVFQQVATKYKLGKLQHSKPRNFVTELNFSSIYPLKLLTCYLLTVYFKFCLENLGKNSLFAIRSTITQSCDNYLRQVGGVLAGINLASSDFYLFTTSLLLVVARTFYIVILVRFIIVIKLISSNLNYKQSRPPEAAVEQVLADQSWLGDFARLFI